MNVRTESRTRLGGWNRVAAASVDAPLAPWGASKSNHV